MEAIKLFSIGQVADRVQVPPSTLRLWERNGEVPSAQRIGLHAIRGWDEASVAVIERKAEKRRTSRSGKAA